MILFLLLVFAYLLGGVPVGYLVARAKGVDIFKEGSGNIGATNVKRVLGNRLGYLVFALDVLKGLLPTLVARALISGRIEGFDAQFLWFLVGTAAVIGHCLSPFLGFRGGKGISTALGAILGTSPVVALLCFGLFAVVLATSRYMSVASTVGVLSVIPFSLLIPGQTRQLLPIFALLAFIVVVRHRQNYGRLRAGTEPRFSLKKTAPPPTPRASETSSEDAEPSASNPVPF